MDVSASRFLMRILRILMLATYNSSLITEDCTVLSTNKASLSFKFNELQIFVSKLTKDTILKMQSTFRKLAQ